MQPAASGGTGLIPQSTALAEAGAGSESIAELLSRDPEGYTKQDRVRIVEIFRDQAKRWKQAEGEKKQAKLAGPKDSKTPKALQDLLASSPKTAEDLGF